MAIMDKKKTALTASTIATALREGKKLKDLIEEGASDEEIATYVTNVAALSKALEGELEAGKTYFRNKALEIYKAKGTTPVIFASPSGPIKVSDLGRKTLSAAKNLLTEGKARMSAAIYQLLFREETKVVPADDYAEKLKAMPPEVQGVMSMWVTEKDATPKVEFPPLPTA